MRKAMAVAGLVALGFGLGGGAAVMACRAAGRVSAARVEALVIQIDSAALEVEWMGEQLREQVVLVGLARAQMTRYAAIVARDPSQSRFLVGWTRRAFEGVEPER